MARWVAYLEQVGEQPGQLLAANTQEYFAQWAYHTFGRITGHADGFAIDLSGLPDILRPLVSELPVIVELSGYVRPGRPISDTFRPVWYRRQGARAFIGVKVLDGRSGEITFDAAAGPLQPVVYRENTANILDLIATDAGLELHVEVYGRQTIELAPGFPPARCEVIEGRIVVEAEQRHEALGIYRVTVRGHDTQGEVGRVRMVGRLAR